MNPSSYSKTLEDGDVIGSIEGVTEGSFFKDRQELHDKKLHRGLMRGIAPKGLSVVLSGGYPDDQDNGDIIVYTGEGGRDSDTSKQIAHQDFSGGNKALAANHLQGIPIRVIRGTKYAKNIPDGFRYRYDGLYQVAAAWHEKGRDDFWICRFRLEKVKGEDIIDILPISASAELEEEHNLPKSRSYWVTRKIRSTDKADDVKIMYDYTCQVCSTQLKTPRGLYAEGCHIKALGKPHEGPDSISNILCLCPNCHVLFDEVAFHIEDDFTIRGARTGKLIMNPNHPLRVEFLAYHRSLKR